jgi:hypothetical protein
VLPVAFLVPALWSPFELLGATAVVVFGGCGGGLCGCGCGCLNPNNEERPCRCSGCCCCFCCCCVAERFLGPQSSLQPQVSLVLSGGGEARGRRCVSQFHPGPFISRKTRWAFATASRRLLFVLLTGVGSGGVPFFFVFECGSPCGHRGVVRTRQGFTLVFVIYVRAVARVFR